MENQKNQLENQLENQRMMMQHMKHEDVQECNAAFNVEEKII